MGWFGKDEQKQFEEIVKDVVAEQMKKIYDAAKNEPQCDDPDCECK